MRTINGYLVNIFGTTVKAAEPRTTYHIAWCGCRAAKKDTFTCLFNKSTVLPMTIAANNNER